MALKQLGYSVPLIWDRNYIDEIIKLEQPDACITDFYGCIEGTPFRSGRIALATQLVKMKDACLIADYIHSKGKKIKYLLNAPERSTMTVSLRDKKSFIKFLYDGLGADAVVVTEQQIFEMVLEVAPGLEIHVSTIAGVRDSKSLSPYLRYRPTVVVPHHDTGKNLAEIDELLNICKKNDIEIELMVTESCLWDCPWREDHYLTLVDKKDDSVFHRKCAYKRLTDPLYLITCGGFILPQQVRKYNEIGINRFKITGRSKGADYLLKTTGAYLKESFSGNAVSLMGMASQSKPEQWLYVDTRVYERLTAEFLASSDVNWIHLARQHYVTGLQNGMIKMKKPPFGVL